MHDFVTMEEEKDLVEYLQQATWTLSQSGRMKLDYGLTKVNFKKRKVKHQEQHLTKFPQQSFFLTKRIREYDVDDEFKKIMKGFEPIELNILRYEA